MMNKDTAIIELREGTGGEEAKIWAQDLARMYTRYAHKRGFKVEVLSDGVLKISGFKAYEDFKFEAGVHRVQRIPETERHGRIHTSTATVAVLPEIPETQIRVSPRDCQWQFYRASSQGGQNVQKVSSAVRLIHRPSGLVVTCEKERGQEQNRQIALLLLRAKLWEREEEKRSEVLAQNRSAIGRGMRAEKIRTYNFPQSRVTEHRINKSWQNLEAVMDGDLNKIVSTLQQSSSDFASA